MIRRRPKTRKTKVKSRKSIVSPMHVVDIVADGALAHGHTAGGLHIPVVFLDTSQRSDIDDVFLAHSYEHLDHGDAESIWIGTPDSSWIGLDVRFKRPVEARAVIKFRMPKYAMLVNLALTAKALYIHPGKPGSKFSDHYFPSENAGGEVVSNSPSLMLQIPHGGFELMWKKIYRSQLVAYFKNAGSPSDEAAQKADKAISRIDDLSNFRLQPQASAAEGGKMLYLNFSKDRPDGAATD